MYSNPAHLPNFATPKPKRPGVTSRRDKSCQLGSREKLDTITSEDMTEAPAFVTPKVSNMRQRKEKFQHRPLSNKSGLGTIGFGRNTDSVPTAHVSPSPLVQSHPTPASRHGNLAKFPSEENIRSKDIDQAPRRSYGISAIESQLSTTAVSQAWIPHQNVAVESVLEEFHALDPNMTTDPTYLPNDRTYLPNDRELYKKGISVGLASRQGYTKAGSTTADRSDLAATSGHHDFIPSPYSSYTQDLYHCPQQFPHSTSVPNLATPSERYYPSGRTAATLPSVPAHNPAAYSTSDYSSPYPASSHGNPTPQRPGDHFTSDLTSWQQKHQEALRRQQIEASQPTQHLSSLPFHHATQTSATNILLGDPHKLEAIKRAADNIIKEKDMIIERQKGRILDLERHTESDSELQRQKDLLQNVLDDSGGLQIKLQENQYENASLKAKLTEYVTTKKSAQDEMERKLNASEYEIQHLKQKLCRESVHRTEEIGQLADELKVSETQLSEARAALTEERTKKEPLRKQLDSMERYVADLPTAEEHSQRTEEIQCLRDEVSRCKRSIGDRDKKFVDAQKGVKSRDVLIQTLEKKEISLKDKLEKLQGEHQRLRQLLEHEGLPTDDIEELQYQKRQLQADLDKAKKLLENMHKRQQQMEAQHRVELFQVEERLCQEESAVTALREEVAAKEQNLIKLRKSIKELGGENQDLLQKMMSQRDTIQELEKQLTGDVHRLENRLMKEIGVCFSELQSVVQICVQHAEGKDPNISALLGVKASTAGEPEPEVDAKDVASLKFKVSKVREMRNEIDKLRELISNKYAEDMGENLNCTTQ